MLEMQKLDDDRLAPVMVPAAQKSSFHLMSDLTPYTIMSSDTSSLLLTNIKLTEENYERWARSFLNAMKGKQKEYFIDGILERPDEGSTEL